MTDLIGRTLDQYQLIELIDQSGTALVYRGFQPSMSRYVAVKVLSPKMAGDPAAVTQFKQQAELLARMEHRNLLPVYDFGQQEGVIYRVSRFVEGGTLKEHLSWFYNPQDSHHLIQQVVEGLNYIHGQGLIHGNLKPSNIFLDEDRRPLLTDFGFVQRVGATPNVYLSPEQTQGSPVDRRTDIYALGVILYEMLVGEPPPAGVVASPRAKRPDLPLEVEQVIFKAMAQNPDYRYQSGQEFAQALAMALMPKAPAPPAPQPVASQPVPVTAPPPPAKAKRDTSWLVFMLGGLFILIIILGILLALFGGLDGNGSQPIVTEEPPIVQPTQELPEATQPPLELPTEVPPAATEPPGDGGEEESEGGILDQVCGSVGIGGGAIVLGLGMKRRRSIKGRTNY